MLKKFFLKRKLNIIFSLCAIAVMLLAWVIAYYSVKNDYIIPSLADTAVSFWNCLKSGDIWLAFFNTLGRTVLAFIVSFLLAVLLAIPSVLSKAFCAFIKPVISFLRTLPTLAVVLILLVWTNPKIAPVIVTVLVLFPMIYSQIIAAVGGIDGELKEMAEVYNLKKCDRVFKIYLPLISPNILSQGGANVSLGLKVMISSEVLANTFKSLGGMMQSARLNVEMPRLAALTIIAVITGFVIEIALSQLERLTYKWKRKEERSD